MTKMTYVNAIDDVLALIVNFDETYVTFHDDDLGTSHDRTVGEVREKLEALKASLVKRNSHKATGMTKKQEANEEIKMKMVETMTEIGEAKTAGEIGSLMGISNQKASALLNQLVKAEKVAKTSVKGKSLFAVA